jgi:hypothetical protein
MVPSTSTITSGKGGGEPSDIDRDLDVGVRFDRERVACPPGYTAWDWQGGWVMGWDDGRVASASCAGVGAIRDRCRGYPSEVAEWATGITRLHPSS